MDRVVAQGPAGQVEGAYPAYDELVKAAGDRRPGEAQIVIPTGERLGDQVIDAEGISKGYGDRLLIDDLSFKLPPGGIVGVIGPNGAGKTTLFRMITGQEKPDSGSITIGETVHLAYVDQSRDSLDGNKTVWEEISGGNDIIKLGKHEMNSRAYCSTFNFKGGDQQQKVGTLSGGQRNRVHLAKLLKSGGNVLLLDEPTNDLDTETLGALEEALENFAGCAVVISHDRMFLDRLATHILAFEGDSHVEWFEGNFEDYEQDKIRRLGADSVNPKRVTYKHDIPRPPELGGGMEQRYWTAVHTLVSGDGGSERYVMQNTVDVTDIVSLRQAASLPFRRGETQLLERAREAEEQHRALLSESAEFRRLFQLAPGFFAVLSGPDHVFTFANDAYIRLVGERELIGKSVREAIPEVSDQGLIELLDRVYQTGMQYQAEAQSVMIRNLASGELQETFLDFSYDAIRDAEGKITGVFVQGSDRSEDVRRQHRQRLLLAELNHRVKNTLASVQSIVSQTLRSAPDPATAKRDIASRLAALSKAHNLLSAQEWTSADLGEIIGQEVAVFDPERISLDGPSFTVSPRCSISLAMLIHELSTNAVKYGALSSDTGTVTIDWREQPDGCLTLAWRETGGPPAAEPVRKGFGTRLIESIVSGELGGTYEPSFREQGFSCIVTLEAGVLRGGKPGHEF
jgi:two-component sensor histidine kinase/ABC-type multidrug transport system ATPase subunit